MVETKFLKLIKECFDLKKKNSMNENINKFIDEDSLNKLKFINFISEHGLKNSSNNLQKYKTFKDILKALK